MRAFFTTCCLWLVLQAHGALTQPSASLVIQSQSGQFVVSGPREVLPSPAYLANSAKTNFVLLNQARLATICERVKNAILNELGDHAQWRGRAFLTIHPEYELEAPMELAATRTEKGWFFHIDLPSEVNPSRLLRLITQIVLVEIATRNPGAREVELPPWLVPGLTAHLQAIAGDNLIIRPEERVVKVIRGLDPMKLIRQRLGERLPLALDELNWPPEEHLAMPPGGFYETCSHFLVLQLLRMKDGPESFRRMLARLPGVLNWQTAFLEGFAPNFASLRDAEKWWSLHVASVTGRDPARLLSVQESYRKLEEILTTTARTPAANTNLVIRSEATLQTIVSRWSFSQQKPLLREKIQQLQHLRLIVSRELVTLTDDYRKTLEDYLQRRSLAGITETGKKLAPDSPIFAAKAAVKQLDMLDVIRGDIKAIPTARMSREEPPTITLTPAELQALRPNTPAAPKTGRITKF